MLVLCLIGIYLILACYLYEINTQKTLFLTVTVMAVFLTLVYFSSKCYESIPEEYEPVSANVSSCFSVDEEVYQKENTYYIADKNKCFWIPFTKPNMVKVEPTEGSACNKCGTLSPNGSKYCSECGNKLL